MPLYRLPFDVRLGWAYVTRRPRYRPPHPGRRSQAFRLRKRGAADHLRSGTHSKTGTSPSTAGT